MDKQVIEAHNLTKQYSITKRGDGLKAAIKNIIRPTKKTIKAVNQLNFSVTEGETVGFIGQNGAGKTTTIKMLTGTLFPTSGYCKVNGFDPVKRSNAFKKSISVVMGNRSQLFPDLTPRDYLKLLQTMYEIDDQEFEQNVNTLAETLNITHLLDTQTRKLSLGERMKVEFLAGVVTKPKVLFLDEPTIGLDVLAKRDLRKFLVKLNKKEKLTIFLTSHDMEDIAAICDQLIIVNQGEIIWNGRKKNLLEQFGQNKYISFNKAETFAPEKIKTQIIDQDDLTITLKVPNNRVDEELAALARAKQGSNFQIHDLKLEDIILEIFAREKKSC